MKAQLVALSFDDGYESQYSIAKLLYKKGIKATFYIITHRSQFDGKPLLTTSPEKLIEMSKMGHELGSHTKLHPDLTKVDINRVFEELRDSKIWLENLGLNSEGFAYPYGFYNDQVITLARQYYTYARHASAYPSEMPKNNGYTNPYQIGGAARKHLLALPKMVLNNWNPVLVLHDIKAFTVLTLINYLRIFCPSIRFVTVTELVTSLKTNVSET